MEDLKIVFYILVAIVWVVYNNYRKLNQQAKKRDSSKPPPEVIIENWPPIKPSVPKPSIPKPADPKIPSWPTQPSPGKEIRKPAMQRREPLRTPKIQRPAKEERPVLIAREGGNIKPSKVVQFEEEAVINETENLVIKEIKNTDFRQAVILSEILKRPYY